MDYKGLQVFWPCLLPDELLSLTVLLTLQAVLGELTLGSSNVPRTVLPRDLHACHSLRLICPQHHPHSFSKYDPLSGHLALSFLCSHPSVLRSSSGSGPPTAWASSSSPSWTAAGATWEASEMADGYRSQDRASCCPSDSSQSWSGSREVTKRMQGCCYEFRLLQSGRREVKRQDSSNIQTRRG